MRNRLLFILLFLLISAIANGSAVDGNNGRKQLKWPNRSIKVFVSASLFGSAGSLKSDTDINSALVRALSYWEEAADIDFEIAFTEITSISPAGAAGDGVSVITVAPDAENLNAFSGKMQHSPGVTRVFFDQRGIITEADIALNPSQLFTTDGTLGTFDLEAVLTHEIGHLLGLSHSEDASAVMFDGVSRNGNFDGSAGTRGLSADDRSKIRKLYGAWDTHPGSRSTIRARVGSSSTSGGRFHVWIQDARTGALLEVAAGEANRQIEFGNLRNGIYEIFAQPSPRNGVIASAVTSGAKDIQGDTNVAVPYSFKSVPFDIRYIGLNGLLGRRGLRAQAGSSYNITLAGPGLHLEELRFGASAAGIQLDPIGTEFSTLENNLSTRTFRLSIAPAVAPGQYSIFVQDATGSRRYMTGAIAVY